MKKTCILIAGPTASGKTSLAIDIARFFKTQIISADSRQCYKELTIGAAKPSPDELEKVHHYFINCLSVKEPFSAADYEQYALLAVNRMFENNDVAVIVGGTGLYIKAFCEGMDEIPAVDETIRSRILKNYEAHGIEWLQSEVKNADPLFYASGEIQNPHRLMRALEVMLSTGRSIVSYQSKQKKRRNFEMIKIGLQMPRADLYNRINERVDGMMNDGLVAEATELFTFRALNALQTVGYKELFDYFDGKISLEKAVDLIKQNTRHYAKRQMTWFKKDQEIFWANPHDQQGILNYINAKLD